MSGSADWFQWVRLRELSFWESVIMAGLFAKAANAVKKTEAKKPKVQTLWRVDDGERGARVAAAIATLHELNGQAKAIDAKMNLAKTIVKSHAEAQFVDALATQGVFPETPMTVQNKEGQSVTFVVQDRSSQSKVTQDQRDQLVKVLGEGGAAACLYEETTFGFDRALLAKPGVLEMLEQHLGAAFEAMQESGVLDAEEASALLTADVRLAFKPGTVDKLPLICGQNAARIEQVLAIMNSACVRYIRV